MKPLRGAKPWPMPLPLDGAWPEFPRLGGAALVLLRATGFVLWTLACMPVQAVMLALPGRGKAWFTTVYWSGVCRLFSLRVRVIGSPATGSVPVVFASNHSSWLDIAALGAKLRASFIAKDQIGRWPGVSLVAKLGRTIYVSRRATGAARENTLIRDRIAAGDSLVLFPEGTTSDGARVMPFRSAFLAIAETDLPVIVQPVSIVYDELDYLPVRREERALFAWFGDMSLAPHFAQIGRHRGLRVSIIFHPPFDPASRPGRKYLAQESWRQAAEGAALLRRNPLGVATSLQTQRAGPETSVAPGR
jgi:1-acyl-sn-glycerol-3-phosphate acyltransferase